MAQDRIAFAIGFAVVPLIEMILLATRKARARKEPATGELTLEYGRGLKAFAVFGALFFSLMVVISSGILDPSGGLGRVSGSSRPCGPRSSS